MVNKHHILRSGGAGPAAKTPPKQKQTPADSRAQSHTKSHTQKTVFSTQIKGPDNPTRQLLPIVSNKFMKIIPANSEGC